MHGPQRYISNLSVWHRRNDNSLPTLYNLDFKFLFTTLHKSSKKINCKPYFLISIWHFSFCVVLFRRVWNQEQWFCTLYETFKFILNVYNCTPSVHNDDYFTLSLRQHLLMLCYSCLIRYFKILFVSYQTLCLSKGFISRASICCKYFFFRHINFDNNL